MTASIPNSLGDTIITPDLDRLATFVRNVLPGPLLGQPDLLLARDGRLSVVQAPFDHVPLTARIAIVGITPGRAQGESALQAFRHALLAGCDIKEALRRAKLTGSFSGPLRRNLTDMLDHVGVHAVLGIETCAALFDPARELAHFTSALRYPVFVGGANYNGTPDMLRVPLLRGMVERFLAEEVRALPGAVWLPLGGKPAAALRHLVQRGVLPVNRVLDGMPHPSGANQERVSFFLGRKAASALSSRCRPEPIEQGRAALLAQVAQLRSA